MADRVRHVLGLSGGKDSAALAVLMYKQVPDMEYFFCDTGKELPETYDYLERLKARLGITITRLEPERGFDHWLDVKRGVLPSPRMRWCTEYLKIRPLEKWLGDSPAVSYVGIRADERRDGYISTKTNITPVFPFKERGLVKADVYRILEESGVGIPSYYTWRSRSGCSFCFYQRKYEWVMLHDTHPGKFWEAVAYEETHDNGRKYTWSHGETLRELIARREEILDEHKRSTARELKVLAPNRPLVDVLASVLDEEDDEAGCNICHI